ncbi:IucA/IucC family siderophore biosynthesis protein [Pseudovibrio sp. Ad37]|uniref:IucA/IucC family protein n=1 Tax=Pseudovibrio sp. Ad37 TaxID=989422 RepID=UPI0007AE6252|nr:IucA/IucC family protein [Pseudovibrio sp. Ad37]KZL24429.1 Aerobactin synthase [Pseudovibrio sp. Ad37]
MILDKQHCSTMVTDTTTPSPLWPKACQTALAKLLSELTYEEVLDPTCIGGETFELRLASGVLYTFQAQTMIWGNLWMDAGSITRAPALALPLSPLQFSVDAQAELGMRPETLATFLREMSNTLRQDLFLTQSCEGYDAEALLQMQPYELHALLEGHPKAVANKGRLGWGAEDVARFAPESQQPIELLWLAARREHCEISDSDIHTEKSFLKDALGATEMTHLMDTLKNKGGTLESYCLVPVHPWQWDHVLQQTYINDLQTADLIMLGSFGGRYVSGPSLRTLTSLGRPESPDVKVALTILNTSAWRGIPGKYIAHGSDLSEWLDGIVQADDHLKNKVSILKELRGVWYRHPFYQQLRDIPYQHNETLGVIWREPADYKVGPNRRAYLYAALLHKDGSGVPLAAHLAQNADLDLTDWLQKLFEVTVVPLYHMLCVYGLGFIAHGQNITVVLEDNVPVGMAIKDLQGDVDLVNEIYPEQCDLTDELRALLPAKPPAYIVHDIQTAHFVTVLRFLSSSLAQARQMTETCFYQILADTLKSYIAANPEYSARFKTFELFAPTIPRVCINKVRFEIGYGDSAERPLPALGMDLRNSLLC